mmetsp:Transcript_8624/g.13616  ORF Transcript_8624/g.13616 Transcript_8624/m.13616 type:complete len:212 (-) Transcript_8624:34-669(-)
MHHASDLWLITKMLKYRGKFRTGPLPDLGTWVTFKETQGGIVVNGSLLHPLGIGLVLLNLNESLHALLVVHLTKLNEGLCGVCETQNLALRERTNHCSRISRHKLASWNSGASLNNSSRGNICTLSNTCPISNGGSHADKSIVLDLGGPEDSSLSHSNVAANVDAPRSSSKDGAIFDVGALSNDNAGSVTLNNCPIPDIAPLSELQAHIIC